MSTTTPYKTRSAGFVLNTESTTAPSTLDASQNTALKNRVVTVGSDTYFVDATGKAAKLSGSEAVSVSPTGQAISIGTQAALDALADKPAGGYYIVTDGASKGDVLVWADTNDDGIGDTWQTALVPTEGIEWTVLTNAAGLPAGQYTYSLATDTWTKTAEFEPLIPPVDDPIAVGGIKFPTQKGSYQQNNGPIFILFDSVAGFGATASSASEDGTTGTIAASARAESLRKAPITQYQQSSPYAQIVNYRPYLVDVHQNSQGAVALDHQGVLYFKGNATFMQAFSSTESALSSLAAPAYTPDKFWANRTVKALKIFLSESANTVMALAGDGTIWIKGDGAGNGIYGDGTTAVNTLWHQVAVPQKAYKRFGVQSSTHAFALADDGELYLWGNNATNRILNGVTGVIATPTNPSTLPSIKDVDMDANSTVAISSTGVRWYIGTNTNGKFGDGTTTAKTVWTDGSAFSNGFVFDRVIANVRGVATPNAGYNFITTDGRAVYTGMQNVNRGISGATSQSNVVTPTLMGSGAYQGAVVDIRSFNNSTLIQTNQGEVWTCVNGSGATYGEHGWGTNTAAGNNIGLNVFRKAPVPSPVVTVYSVSNGSTEYATSITALTTEGRIYNWGGMYGDIQNSQQYRRAPYEIPHNQFRPGDPKALQQVDLMKIVGTITSASPLTITDIVDGVSGQTVTATFLATGKAGKVDLTGTTVTGPDITFLSWNTWVVYMNSTTQIISVQFTIDAADIATLVSPNTAPQNWVVNLFVNGV